MKLLPTSLIFVCLSSSIALAQDLTAINGKWNALFQSKEGFSAQATVVIADTTGTWQSVSSRVKAGNRENPCIGREFPLTVQSRSAAEIVIQMNQSTLIHGCPNSTLTLKTSDNKTLEGNFEDGRPIKLVRQ